jgi:ABC-type Mn2+/Zn2+ transport system permease subunit
MQWLLFSRRGAIKEDTALGVLFAAALSLGVVLISTFRTYAVDLSHILFGNVLGVNNLDLWLTAGLGALILVAILVFYRPFLVISFDPILAATLRMRVDFYRNLLLILLALTIVVSMQTVGVGLVAALLVTPAATAYLLVRRLPSMMALSALFGAFSSLTGLFASYYLNVASGAAIVLTATILFLLAFLFSPSRGFIWEFAGRRTV